MRFIRILIILLSLHAIIAEAEEPDFVMFCFDSSPVNQAIIKAYNSDPTVWTRGNLFIVGLCYTYEKNHQEAEKIFKRLTQEEPQNTRYARCLANAAYLNGDLDEAKKLYSSLWETEKDVYALKVLGIIAVQQDDIEIIRSLIGNLQIHKAEDIDIRKAILLYCLKEEDLLRAKSAYSEALQELKKSEIDENPDFRKVLIMAMLKFGDLKCDDNAELKNSSDDSSSGP